MDWNSIYSAANGFAIIGWIALAFAPLARTKLIWAARGVALIMSVFYLYMLLFTTTPVPDGNFTSIDGITKLFSLAPNAMLGWAHYLAFDLFIGSWETEDAGARGVPHWLLVPCLFLTLMVGPVGLLTYFVVRTLHARMRTA